MKKRYLDKAIDQLAFADHKMAFVSGPRQAGKTTLGEMLRKGYPVSQYYNWDDLDFRYIWSTAPKTIIPDAADSMIVLDEIHKDRTWKRTLKGIYDTNKVKNKHCDIFVTGSAKLNVYRRGSDSLLGRYYHFRLAPFSLREMHHPDSLPPDEAVDSLFGRGITAPSASRKDLDALIKFGPFPEPLFRQDENRWRIWRRNRHEMVIREDLRDVGQTHDLGKVEMLAAILPDKVGAPLSINSLKLNIEVSHPTLQRWLGWLKELYFLFEVKPWSKKIVRSLRKESKVYLWDFSEVRDAGARFENLVAVHLLKAVNYWNDTGQGEFGLYYLRNREKQEIDFLITKDNHPWLPVEVKRSDDKPSENWRTFLPMLGCSRALQITEKPAWKIYHENDATLLIAGANDALLYFP